MTIKSYLYVIINLSEDSDIMKKFFILMLAALILLSGCVGQRTVKPGDNVSVDYIGTLVDGKVFDTSIESVAKANDLFTRDREYTPLNFSVGKPGVIKGLSEGVVGMKVGETKTLTISPENGYGPVSPMKISVIPTIQEIPTKMSRVIEVPIEEFEGTLGSGHKIGDIITLPNTDINMTIINITNNVSLSYNFKVGDKIPYGLPWNVTVGSIDTKNITINHNVKKNETFQFQIDQFQKTPWNTTVVNITSMNNIASMNITLRHNPIPDTVIQSMFGPPTKVHFNETSIIMDSNHELTGKTLIFNVTLRSINK